MRRVKCYDCGRRYDFDVDDFCPKCGAFTQPPRTARIGADGSVVRAEGINERNHANSFVHAELHAENGARRGTFLEGGPTKRSGPQRGKSLRSGISSAGRTLNEAADLLDGLLGIRSRI